MYDDAMLLFCCALDEKVLARDPHAHVALKRLPKRQPWFYVIVIENRHGEQEAYEIDVSRAEWIKLYGSGWEG